MKDTLRFLELLKEEFPTRDSIHPRIEAFNGNLHVLVWFPRFRDGKSAGHRGEYFLLTPDQLEKSPKQLVADIREVVEEKGLDKNLAAGDTVVFNVEGV